MVHQMMLFHRRTSWILFWTTRIVPSWTSKSFIVKNKTKNSMMSEFSCCYCVWWITLKLFRPSAYQTPYWAFHTFNRTKDQPRTSMCPMWAPVWVAYNRAASLNTSCQPLLFKTFSPFLIAPLNPSGPTPISNDSGPCLKQRRFSMIALWPFSLLIPQGECFHTQVWRYQLCTDDSEITSRTLTLLMNARPQFLVDC